MKRITILWVAALLITALWLYLTTDHIGFMLPPIFTTVIYLLIAIPIGGVLAFLLKNIFFKNWKIREIFLILISLFGIYNAYYLYRPKYEIIIPKGFEGQINLIVSKTDENDFELDSNGFGLVKESIYNKDFMPVYIQEGKKLEYQPLGYGPGRMLVEHKYYTDFGTVKALTGDIRGSNDSMEHKSYYTDLNELISSGKVEKSKIKFYDESNKMITTPVN